jgi:hypothetical protein
MKPNIVRTTVGTLCFAVTATALAARASATTRVQIDVKPGICPNVLPVQSSGRLAVTFGFFFPNVASRAEAGSPNSEKDAGSNIRI